MSSESSQAATVADDDDDDKDEDSVDNRIPTLNTMVKTLGSSGQGQTSETIFVLGDDGVRALDRGGAEFPSHRSFT